MKKVLLFICFCTVLFCASCGVFKTYEDTNGEDNYELQEITEDMLINKKGGVQIAAVTSEVSKNGVTNIKLSVGELHGISEVHEFSKGSYVMTLNYQVSSGNTRLVLTDGESIVKEFNINEDDQVYEFTCAKRYYLKVAGEACKFSLKAEIKEK